MDRRPLPTARSRHRSFGIQDPDPLPMQPSRTLRIRYRQSIMPLDDLTLELNTTPRPAPAPELEVMTRVLRLPTRSPRQARSIVRMQLDRLSPLPASDTTFDLVALRQDVGETVYALGILRRSVLADAAFASQRTVAVTRSIEDQDVVFRFRNAGAVDDREARWLRHAPKVAILCLGLTAVALAGDLRAEQWRERRLPEIAAAKRLAAQEVRQAGEQASARTDWAALERADAATRFLCVGGRIRAAAPAGVAVTSATADPQQVTLTMAGANGAALANAGGRAAPGADPNRPGPVVFPREVCG